MAVDTVGDGFQGVHGSLVQNDVLALAGHAAMDADGAPVNGCKRDVELVLIACGTPELFHVLAYRVAVAVDWNRMFECREVVHGFSLEDFFMLLFFSRNLIIFAIQNERLGFPYS